MRQVPTLKRDQVKFIDCTASNVKRLEVIHVAYRKYGFYVRQDSAKTCWAGSIFFADIDSSLTFSRDANPPGAPSPKNDKRAFPARVSLGRQFTHTHTHTHIYIQPPIKSRAIQTLDTELDVHCHHCKWPFGIVFLCVELRSVRDVR
jgi:hypothetical protein